MSRNNPVGNIPIETPLLRKMVAAVNDIYLDMSEDEVRELDKEIKSVTDTNCSADVKCMAEMFACCVDEYVKRYLH